MKTRIAFPLVAALVVAIGIAVPVAAAPANLVANPSLEAGAAWPDCFSPSGWGTEATWSAVTGHTGARAVSMTIAGYASGDRKLLPTESATCAPAVTPGETYRASIWYKATAPVSMTVFRHTAAGWSYWGELGALAATTPWAEASAVTPPIPAGTDRITFGISLAASGTLVTDDYSLTNTKDTGTPTPTPTPSTPAPTPTPTTPPATPTPSPTPTTPASAELIVNGTLAAGATTPNCFFTAGWGTRNVAASIGAAVPAGSAAGTRSMTYAVTGYQSGDVKLLPAEAIGCAPAVVVGQKYSVSVDYRSTGTAHGLTAFQHTTAGWSYWTELKTLPGSAGWVTAKADLPAIPAGVDRISFGISLASNGTLSTTNYSMKATAPPIPTPTPTPTPPAGNPAAIGSWSVLDVQMPIRALHTTLLYDGRLLLIAGSGNDGNAFAAGTFTASVWDPSTGLFTAIPTPYDMFCVGHVTLPDGKVLLAGGTEAYPTQNQGPNTFKGSKKSYYFDPEDDTFHPLADMAGAHWYPTLTKLGDGDIWAAGGLNENAEGTVLTEMFDSQTMSWLPANQVPQTWSFWGTYPHMYLLDDGVLFYAGGHTFGNGLPGSGASLYNWRTAQIWDVPGLRQKDLRDQAGSVLLPPAQDQRVMIVGGGNTDSNNPAINLVDIIDLSVANPTYTAGPSMPGAGKMYVNLVTLPNRTVLASNGATGNRSGNVLTAAIYNPTANAWTTINPDPVGRNYHSTSTLLPDGRVVVFGSNPVDNTFESKISIYTPAYMYQGTRPTVNTVAEQLTYGQSFPLTVTGNAVSASLMSPMSPTHQTDTNTRLVDLPIAGTGGTRTAQVPANPNLLPPGPYMLTVLDAAGVPSVADWVWIS